MQQQCLLTLVNVASALQVVKDLMGKGYVPSWCTACYRKGRTGEHFMKIAKAGNIHNFCHPNSLLTLQVSSGASAAAAAVLAMVATGVAAVV